MYLPTDNLKTYMEQNPEAYKGIFPEHKVNDVEDEKTEEKPSFSDKTLDKSQEKK